MDNEASVANAALTGLREFLPSGWFADLRYATERSRPDAWLSISTASGLEKRFAVEIQSRFEPKDVDRLLRQVQHWRLADPVMLLTAHLSSRSQEVLRQHGLSYADADGNLWLYDDPVFIARHGEAPRVRGRGAALKRKSLRGQTAARIIRYVLEARPPLKVRQIAAKAHADPGNVSHLIKLLENEHFLRRDERATVVDVDWEGLIQAWGLELEKDRVMQTFLAPRGIRSVVERLTSVPVPYAVTGAFAAAQIVPVALAMSIDLYARDIYRFSSEIGLHATQGIGNVRIIQAYDDVVFERTLKRDDFVLANPSQIAADLVSLPKRSKDEYAELIGWMRNNEHIWRTA